MMNIYGCFSPTILIIYKYFQFSSSRSTTACSASPETLRRTHNNTTSSSLLSTQDWVMYHICRFALGCSQHTVSRISERHSSPEHLLWPVDKWFGCSSPWGHSMCSWLPPARSAMWSGGNSNVSWDPSRPAPTTILFDPSVTVQTAEAPSVSPHILQCFLFHLGL